jgi:hypothetical protein
MMSADNGVLIIPNIVDLSDVKIDLKEGSPPYGIILAKHKAQQSASPRKRL